jgi:hypothetical protein
LFKYQFYPDLEVDASFLFVVKDEVVTGVTLSISPTSYALSEFLLGSSNSFVYNNQRLKKSATRPLPYLKYIII